MIIVLRFFRFLILSVGFILCSIRIYAQEVTVLTDKTQFARSEKINITLSNKSKESIFSIAASSTPGAAISILEKKITAEQWNSFEVDCNWPDCDRDYDGPVEIRAGKSVSFSWEPHIYVKPKYPSPEFGVYRLSLLYQVRKDNNPKNWEWLTATSNEFTLK
jgi:hypothetical protein